MKTKLRKDRRLCASCRERPALYRSARGRMVAKADGHSLCAQCYRGERNSTRGFSAR